MAPPSIPFLATPPQFLRISNRKLTNTTFITMIRVLRRSPRGHRGFLLRWTFVLATIALGILLQSEDVGAKLDDFRDDDEFAEFDDLDYEETRKSDKAKAKAAPDVGVDLDEEEEGEFVDEDEDEEFEQVREIKMKPARDLLWSMW